MEFLNAEMSNVEVLAVEVKQFQRAGHDKQKALVPRVVGFSEAARNAKAPSSKRRGNTNQEEFLERCTPTAREFFQRVLERAHEREHVIYWGKVGFSIRAHSPGSEKLGSFAYGFPSCEFQLFFQNDFVWKTNELVALRKRLLDSGVFRKSGDYTLKARVTEETLEQLNDLYDFILNEIVSPTQVHATV